jgi:spore coat protein W
MSKQDPSNLPDKVVELMIHQVFKKNNVNPSEAKKNISDEQKEMLREMVQDLKKQVEQFNNGENNKKKTID